MDTSPEPLQFRRIPTLIFLACLVAGAVAGAMFPYPEWGLAKRMMFGGGLGGFSGLILTFWRMII